MNTDIRFLIVAFDGLRPDMVSEERAPNLSRFARQGVRFPDCRAVFPTETRVNQATLVTGCQPSRHGIVANKFLEAEFGGYLNTTDFAQLSAANGVLGGNLLTVPSLGEILHDAGGSLAVVGCGTPGGNRLLHNHAEGCSALNISLHGIDQSTTPEAAEALMAAMGPIPEAAIPNAARIDWVVDAYMRDVAPNRDPSVAILWFSDPDTPYHYRGIESAEAIAAIRHADAAFGRLLEWRQAQGMEHRLHVIAMSDHGHVATVGLPLGVGDLMSAAGFRLGEKLVDDVDAVLVPGTTASLYVRDSEIQTALAAWLQAQPWCGSIFARALEGLEPPEGTLPLATVHLDHRRAGDLVFSLHRDHALGANSVPGRCLHDNPDIPEGCGLHGGLTPYELGAFLAVDGGHFGNGRKIDTPVGLVDLAPTLLRLLGLGEHEQMDGRILTEAFTENGHVAVTAHRYEASAGAGDGYRQRLIRDEAAGSGYLASGYREDVAELS